VLALSLAGGRARRVLTEERAITIPRSWVSQHWRGRVGSHDSQTREIARWEKGPVDRFKRRFQQGIRKSRSGSKE
jgi:hypothetical protein